MTEVGLSSTTEHVKRRIAGLASPGHAGPSPSLACGDSRCARIVRRLAVRSSFALLAVLAASAAWAAPSISVVAPPPGQPVYDVQPTMTVTYSTDTPQVPLNLETLRITVNGIDWTAKFTQGTSSATYAVSAVDALVAGTLTVEAFVADPGGGSASATQTYEVFPTLRAVAPSIGSEGSEITVDVLGLDPDPSKNKALFTSRFSAAGAEAALLTVDRATSRGTVTVPEGAVSGNLFVSVNGRQSDPLHCADGLPHVWPDLTDARDGGWQPSSGASILLGLHRRHQRDALPEDQVGWPLPEGHRPEGVSRRSCRSCERLRSELREQLP
jgi:hypothetical protein